MAKRFKRHDRELVALREEQKKAWEEIAKLREDMIKGFERHDREITRLRRDMLKGFERIDKRITALGARWAVSFFVVIHGCFYSFMAVIHAVSP